MKPAFCELTQLRFGRGKGRVTYLRGLDLKRNELWCVRGAHALNLANTMKRMGVEVRKGR